MPLKGKFCFFLKHFVLNLIRKIIDIYLKINNHTAFITLKMSMISEDNVIPGFVVLDGYFFIIFSIKRFKVLYMVDLEELEFSYRSKYIFNGWMVSFFH